MSEKRFKIKGILKDYVVIQDGEAHKIIEAEHLEQYLNDLYEQNKQLKKECHLVHMQSMFSTVKSFKGDVSKRYKYDKENDTIYDTANKYQGYSAIIDKKEAVLLLNEYNTLLENK